MFETLADFEIVLSPVLRGATLVTTKTMIQLGF